MKAYLKHDPSAL